MRHIGEAITCNARNSIKIYSRLKRINNIDKRFFITTKFILPLAQRTTAGCLIMFYRDISGRRGRNNTEVHKDLYLSKINRVK